MDFRSDTVTLPTSAMRQAMAAAAVGDDVYGEDPTVNALEALAADKLGFEAALFASSGTQTNLLALLAHCERGDEYIVGQQAHTYKYEGGGAAILGSIQPQPLEFRDDGTLSLSAIEAAIKPDDFHFAKTRLIALENTVSGKVLPLHYLATMREFVDNRGLTMHLDGARVFNASVALGVNITEVVQYFDSVSVCLSKGLCAPVGSVLCGSAGLIQRARRWRKVLGGGMRQAGFIAAAGIVALNENVERLADDHNNAKALFDGLRSLEAFNLTNESVRTNMVFLNCGAAVANELAAHLLKHDILISPADHVRLVLHKDITANDVDTMIAACREFF
ncbi:low-specificity L-threonine aldolase [Chromatiales bacterium (ex Bugula neritina AB1)]|nr:low-specificity L-threonine aldolase [Chromatiales bacterium (ex Bugula neritina AB1)]